MNCSQSLAHTSLKKTSPLELELALQLRVLGIEYKEQVRAIAGRRFVWDFQVGNTLIEVQGGTWSDKRTGHSTGAGIRRDCEKLNLATLNGYKVLSFTADMIHDGTAFTTIEKLVEIGA